MSVIAPLRFLFCPKSILIALLLCLGISVGCHKATSAPAGAKQVDFNISMKKWLIEPAEIRVEKGSVVHLHVTTSDVQHGFDVRALNIAEPVNPGRVTDITFRADKPGKYDVECGILCGRGHDEMEATIVVQD